MGFDRHSDIFIKKILTQLILTHFGIVNVKNI
jgi:hypothetical protein